MSCVGAQTETDFMEEIARFRQEQVANAQALGRDAGLRALGLKFLVEAGRQRYSYNFNWLGIPIIQHPQDIVAMQEIIWEVRPTVIVETGIARGGSLVFSASMLELLGAGRVIGIDIDIRPHNRRNIESHPFSRRIEMIEGSSADPAVLERVKSLISPDDRVLACLDSHHSHRHVLRELELYAPLVSIGSYVVVFDTVIEDMPDEDLADRPWKSGNSPKTAVFEFLRKDSRFEIRDEIENKLLITAAPSGFLKRVR